MSTYCLESLSFYSILQVEKVLKKLRCISGKLKYSCSNYQACLLKPVPAVNGVSICTFWLHFTFMSGYLTRNKSSRLFSSMLTHLTTCNKGCLQPSLLLIAILFYRDISTVSILPDLGTCLFAIRSLKFLIFCPNLSLQTYVFVLNCLSQVVTVLSRASFDLCFSSNLVYHLLLEICGNITLQQCFLNALAKAADIEYRNSDRTLSSLM